MSPLLKLQEKSAAVLCGESLERGSHDSEDSPLESVATVTGLGEMAFPF